MHTMVRWFSYVGLFIFVLNTPATAGYVVTSFGIGSTLFSNPLQSGGANDLNALFNYQIPNGTTISLWNPAMKAFDVTSTYLGGSWTLDLIQNPGTGARLPGQP